MNAHRHAPRPFAFALQGMTAAIAPTTPLAHVQEVWARAVGPTVAEAGRPTAERGGVLTVTCSDSVWAHELTMMGDQLLDNLNSALGGELLHKLRCRTG
jgi:predicted nucleic acid-binding Zn ribbon protein